MAAPQPVYRKARNRLLPLKPHEVLSRCSCPADVCYMRPEQMRHMQDYKPTPYLVEHVHLDFVLNEDKSTVKSKLHMTPNYGDASPPKLELDGESLSRSTAV